MIDPEVTIGHVHLKVSDVERSLGFYRDLLGFDVTGRVGDGLVFLSAGGYHHHLALNQWWSAGGARPADWTTGLYHVAILYPTREALAETVQRLIDAGIAPTGANDHGVNLAVYFDDPDGNGIELCWDRPRDQWPRTREGELAIANDELAIEDLCC